MRFINCIGNDDIAKVYIVEVGNDQIIECVESRQPPLSWDKKWVLIISTSVGCPIQCRMCDAGGMFKGHLNNHQMLYQIDRMVTKRYPDRHVPVDKFKVQFARMGEPALNPQVLVTLNELPKLYNAPGLMPCISTIAPRKANSFFQELLAIKNEQYRAGKFQMQFSIHSTDPGVRDWLVPVPKWSLSEISEYGKRFFVKKDRKIALNFALVKDTPLDSVVMARIFSPDYFMIKITPVNPTYRACENDLKSYISAEDTDKCYKIVDDLRKKGFDTLISIGEYEENKIGSNCGQYIAKHNRAPKKLSQSYTYSP